MRSDHQSRLYKEHIWNPLKNNYNNCGHKKLNNLIVIHCDLLFIGQFRYFIPWHLSRVPIERKRVGHEAVVVHVLGPAA